MVLVAVGSLALVAMAWFSFVALRGPGDEPSLVAVSDVDDVPTVVDQAPWPPRTPRTTISVPPSTEPATTIAAVLPPVPTSGPVTVVTLDVDETAEASSQDTSGSVPTTGPSTTAPDEVAPTTATATTVTTEPPRPPAEGPSYPVLADGAPVPIEVVFDDDTITLTGTVPSKAAIERLKALAIANSKNPDAEVVTDLAVNRDVPINVGVRVIELNSPRFPPGSASLSPQHAAELDRVVALMAALENVNVLVIGHADQRGDPATNFTLSENRALSVVTYLVEQGVSPERTSLRAVGEDNPLSLSENQAALELNRRTEFVFTGLLIDGNAD